MKSLKKFYNSKLFVFIITFIVAFFVWYYYSVVVNPNTVVTIKNVPVNINMKDSVPSLKGYVLLEQSVAAIDVKISCSRYESSKIKSELVSASVDVSSVINPGIYSLPIDVSINKSSLSSDVNVVEKNISSVSLTFDETASKFVPVSVVLSGEAAAPYIIEEPILNTTSVNVSGPKTIVDKIETISCSINVAGQQETKSYTCPIVMLDKNGDKIESDFIETNTNSVAVSVPLYLIKTVPVKINLISSATDGHQVTLINPQISPSNITIKGIAEKIQQIDSISLGDIDFSSINNDYSRAFDLLLPDGSTSEDNVSEANVSISVSGLNTKTISLDKDSIEIRNAANTITIPSGTVDITVFGNEKDLAAITADSLKAYIDLGSNSLSRGRRTVPLYISMDSYENVDVLYKYSVVISVR